MIKKHYCDGPFGQIHVRVLEPTSEPSGPDLYCLHPAPLSGLAFTRIMPHLAQGRRIFAPDYPGHGGSDAHRATPTIAEYAQSMLAVINERSADKPVDLLGFHSGCLVAIELAVGAHRQVNSIALIDVPAFDAKTRQSFLGATAKPLNIHAELDCLADVWAFAMSKRIESVGVKRSFELFVEQLRHAEAMNAAFHAAFTYDVQARAGAVSQPTLIIGTKSRLLEATRYAATLIPGAQLQERLDIERAVLDEDPQSIASNILAFLGPEALQPHSSDAWA